MTSLKLGRQPRAYNPSIPHMSALIAGRTLPPAPLAIDYTKGMPLDLGVMLNDQLGDCTCAAFYHARQVWTFNALKKIATESDGNVLTLYEKACGYNPHNPGSDRGGVEQDVLEYLLNTGAPIGDGKKKDKILAYIEVDPRNLDDLKRVIADFGVAYIGVDVPESVMDNANNYSRPWDWSGNKTIVGGHAVVLVGYDLDYFYCLSWGRKYKITHAFFAHCLEEAYAIADASWIAATGKTPLGMTVTDLEYVMQNLKK